MDTPDPSLEVLPRRERQVISLMSRGLRLHRIAKMLFLSRQTVDTYRQRAYYKLHFHDRVQAAVWATRLGIHLITPIDLRIR